MDENKGNSKVMKLPMGYRFLPSDAQLIFYYLIPKNLSLLLPAHIISPIQLLHFNPWDLPGDPKEKRFFFCKRGRKMNMHKVVTGSGYWKVSGKEVVISDNDDDGISRKTIGIKRKLTFCHKKQSSRDKWVMWEYRLATCSINKTDLVEKKVVEEMGEWMVCAIITISQKKPFITTHHSYNNKKKLNYHENKSIISQELSSSSSCSTMSITTDGNLFSEEEESTSSDN